MSFWLLTFFEGDWREAEIIDYWLNQQNRSSTALVLVPDQLPTTPPTAGAFILQGEEAGMEQNLDANLDHDQDHAIDAGGVSTVTGLGTALFLEPEIQPELGDQEMVDVDDNPIEQLAVVDHISQPPPNSELFGDQRTDIGRSPSQARAETDPTWPQAAIYSSSGGQLSEIISALAQSQDPEYNSLPASASSTLLNDVVQNNVVLEQDFGTGAASHLWEDPLAEQESFEEQDLVLEQDATVTLEPAIQQESAAEQDPTVEPAQIIEQDPETNEDPSPMPGPYPGQNPWEYALQTFYTPRALAGGVSNILAPHLSPQARKRRHADGQRGVNIRANFMVGAETGDIFDLNMCVDEEGIVEETLKGPRAEAGRFWEKLERRLWF